MINRTEELLKMLAEGQLPRDLPEDGEHSKEWRDLLEYLEDLLRFVRALCDGDLSAALNRGGPLAGSLKGLHANLRHLTWQTQQVAAGDFSQRVDFLGEFSSAFNHMVEALADNHNELTEKNSQLAAAYEELKETQSQMLQREKMASIGQLAAGVAHEINNPMGFISSNIGTMRKYVTKLVSFVNVLTNALESLSSADLSARVQDERKKMKIDYILADIEQLVDESLEGADRVTKIVRNLKSFSRIDEADYKMADINECIESTLNIVWNELKYKATVEKVYGEVPPTMCYPNQLNQIFVNILVNAAQAIEKQGEIKIRTWYEGGHINIDFSDSGSGIPEEMLNRIFEPFFTTKPVGKGTGLGLSITYDIVKKHNGEISVESEVGKGTSFHIKIPVVNS
ncbi:MAG: ATP-binding protein, partial [Nitrospirota bacterium]